ncbi:hypothetical protein PoMZ_12754 [Pyricularia oryzae]|uniref:Uncharacterized protein n=1 Tax=Pyricularia oryzae TaxID=318829 RepID=A0A4P7NTN7_PYROR|nr:hypothetical protein PoMZ_12754 [Pyricularia oryzae]
MPRLVHYPRYYSACAIAQLFVSFQAFQSPYPSQSSFFIRFPLFPLHFHRCLLHLQPCLALRSGLALLSTIIFHWLLMRARVPLQRAERLKGAVRRCIIQTKINIGKTGGMAKRRNLIRRSLAILSRSKTRDGRLR